MSRETGGVLQFVAMLLVGVALAALTMMAVSARFFPLSPNSIDVAAGHATFDQKCSGCHAVDAAAFDKFGPNLSNIGMTGATRKPGMNAVNYIVESLLEPDAFRAEGSIGHMPSNTLDGLSPDQSRDLVAYLASLGSTPDWAQLVELNISSSSPTGGNEARSVASTRAGWELFSEKLGCMSCHYIHDMPGAGLVAPSLQKASQHAEDYLISSIRNPSEHISPGYQFARVVTGNGAVWSGRILSQSDSKLELLARDQNGHYQKLDLATADLQELVPETQSRMPPYTLSPEDEANLIAFLKFLQGE